MSLALYKFKCFIGQNSKHTILSVRRRITDLWFHFLHKQVFLQAILWALPQCAVRCTKLTFTYSQIRRVSGVLQKPHIFEFFQEQTREETSFFKTLTVHYICMYNMLHEFLSMLIEMSAVCKRSTALHERRKY